MVILSIFGCSKIANPLTADGAVMQVLARTAQLLGARLRAALR